MNTERKNALAWIAQKVFGLLLIAAAIACFVLVADGETMQERDGGGALVLGGIGLYLLLTRKMNIKISMSKHYSVIRTILLLLSRDLKKAKNIIKYLDWRENTFDKI